MQTHADKNQNGSAHAEIQGANATCQFADRRPAAAGQNRLASMADASLGTAQLLAIQAMADASPGVETTRQLGAGQAATAQRQASEEEEPLQGKFAVAQRQAMEDEEPVQGNFPTGQRQAADEEEPLQGKFAVAQREAEEDEEPVQGKFAMVQRAAAEEDELQMKTAGAPVPAAQLQAEAASRKNESGLPDNLKSGIESLSGLSMDNVRVHYNSSKPAQLNAYAYAQGTDIHLGPGQEKHLPHEAWHVVQQAQGRVQSAFQKAGIGINNNHELEHEADIMGSRAIIFGGNICKNRQQLEHSCPQSNQESSFATNQISNASASLPQGGIIQMVPIVEKCINNKIYEFVVADVAADGSCFLHAFCAGTLVHDFVNQIRNKPENTLTADDVYRDFSLMFEDESIANKSNKPINLQENSKALRIQIAEHLTNNKEKYESDIKKDICAIANEYNNSNETPMGIKNEGELARLISKLESNNVNAQDISNDLINAYINEFGQNSSFWVQEAGIRSTAAVCNKNIIVNNYNSDNEHIFENIFSDSDSDSDSDKPNQNAIELYQDDMQTHYKIMLGPFERGWLKHAKTSDDDHIETDDASGISPQDIDAHQYPWDSPLDSDNDNATNATRSIQETSYQQSTEEHNEADKLHIRKVSKLINENEQETANLIYRAASIFNDKKAFDTKTTDHAVQLIKKYLELKNGSGHSDSCNKIYTPIIPLAGSIFDLVYKYKIPLAEIKELITPSHKYIEFHRNHESWTKTQAINERIPLLNQISTKLNNWSDIYKAQGLRRAPSTAKFDTADLGPGKKVGVRMAAFLTINQEKLTGYEPEDSQVWKIFSENFNGYVRAHLLNKHLGGPGCQDNITILSSKDNNRMSQICEEMIKRLVIEDNKQLEYIVEIPNGRDDLNAPPHLLNKKLTNSMGKTIRLRVREITSHDDNGRPKTFKNIPLEFNPIEHRDITTDNEDFTSFPATCQDDAMLSSNISSNSKKKRSDFTTRSGTAKLNIMLDGNLTPQEKNAYIKAQKLICQLHNTERDKREQAGTKKNTAKKRKLEELEYSDDSSDHEDETPLSTNDPNVLYETLKNKHLAEVSEKNGTKILEALMDINRTKSSACGNNKSKTKRCHQNERNNIIKNHLKEINEVDISKIENMTDEMFKRLKTLLENGAKIGEALRHLKKHQYEALLLRLKKERRSEQGDSSKSNNWWHKKNK